jgi:hypothetical protein
MRLEAVATLICAFALVVSGGVARAQTATPTVSVRTPKGGDLVVVGYVTPPAVVPGGITVEAVSATGLERVVTHTMDGETGRFEARMLTALSARTKIKACVAVTTSAVVCGETEVPAPTPPKPAEPALRPARVGARVIDGFTGRGGPKVSNVVIRVYRGPTDAAAPLELDRVVTEKIDVRGGFSGVLSGPLIDGQWARATACTEDNACTDGPLMKVVDPGDWGRVRAYFAGGVVFSKDNQDFSQQDMLLAFVLDKSWLQAAPYAVEETSNPNAKGSGFAFRSLNTFFDARLTSLPVVSKGTAAPAAAAATPLDQFISSKKGAVVQAGVYLPFYGRATSWRHEGIPNALFIAPVARGGIQTLTGDDHTAEAERFGADDVFNFFSFGAALGHYKLTDTVNRAPEIISYLHVTFGRYEAFEVVPDKTQPDIRKRPWRTVVEGRLKIPESPLQVGFDANIGEGHDDVRFSFATRFDIGELFGKLKSF